MIKRLILVMIGFLLSSGDSLAAYDSLLSWVQNKVSKRVSVACAVAMRPATHTWPPPLDVRNRLENSRELHDLGNRTGLPDGGLSNAEERRSVLTEIQRTLAEIQHLVAALETKNNNIGSMVAAKRSIAIPVERSTSTLLQRASLEDLFGEKPKLQTILKERSEHRMVLAQEDYGASKDLVTTHMKPRDELVDQVMRLLIHPNQTIRNKLSALLDLYAALTHHTKDGISKVLNGQTNTVKSIIYQDVRIYIQSQGATLKEYRDMYNELNEALGGQKLERVYDVSERRMNKQTSQNLVIYRDSSKNTSLQQDISLISMPIDIQYKIKQLASKIRYHDKLYYQQDAPEISDAEYDDLYTEYNDLIQKYPKCTPADDLNQNVGIFGVKRFRKVKHLKPLLSLYKAINDQDVFNFDKRVHKFLTLDFSTPITYVAELKIDGLAGAICYHNGQLVSAATRGDGIYGEDVTENVKTISDVPHQIPLKNENVEIRGEFYISKDDFLKLNKSLLIDNQKTYVSPRNAAAGSLRHLDPDVTAKRHLRFFAYDLVASTSLKMHEAILIYLQSLGFVVNADRKVCTDIQQCIRFYNDVTLRRGLLPYDVDGVVYKVNNLSFQQCLGSTLRAPRFAIAHKFKSQHGITRLNDISVKVSKSGVLTPVAVLEPLNIGGFLVSRATLYNEDEINRKRLKIGDLVVVQRSGDVIPQVVKSLMRHSKFRPYKLPLKCPVCGSKTMRDGKVAIRCTGVCAL